MCYTAIPGQTGCLAARNMVFVPRARVIQSQKSAAKPQIRTMLRGESSFGGGPLEKKNESDKSSRQYKMNVRAANAKQHSRMRPKRTTIRRNFRPT